MKVLIVEDGDEKGKELQLILQMNNHRYQLVRTEKEAKEILRDEKFDMVLLDMELPYSEKNMLSMNKFAGIKILNSMKYYHIEVPVLLITQYWDFVNMIMGIVDTKQIYYPNNSVVDEKESNNTNVNNVKNLNQLHDFMSERYTNYMGAILYSNISNEWKDKLVHLIDKVGGNNNEGTCSGR